MPGHAAPALRRPCRAAGAQHHGVLGAGIGHGPGRRCARAAGDRQRRQPRGLVGRQPGPAPARHRHAGGAARDGWPHHHARHQLQGPVPPLRLHPGRRGGLPARARPRGLRGRPGLALVPPAQPARARQAPGPGAGQLSGQRRPHRQRRGAGYAGLGDRHPAASGGRRARAGRPRATARRWRGADAHPAAGHCQRPGPVAAAPGLAKLCAGRVPGAPGRAAGRHGRRHHRALGRARGRPAAAPGPLHDRGPAPGPCLCRHTAGACIGR